MADKDTENGIKAERQTLDRVRARNRITVARADRRAAELRRATERSERVVERAMGRLRDAGVVR